MKPATGDDRVPRSAIFRQVSGSADVHLVAPAYRGAVLDAVHGLGMPRVVHNEMFDDITETWPLLTGAVSRLDAYGAHGPRSGVRVYGDQPLRVLCLLLGVRGFPAGSLDRRRRDGSLIRALDIQACLPDAAAIEMSRQAMNASTEEMRHAARLLDQPDQIVRLDVPGGHAQRSGPSRYYLTPTMTVDLNQGIDIKASDAMALIETGLHLTLRSEQVARQVLAAFDMNQDEIDSAIRFGQTGQV